jgi:ABC-type multidrug transport system ATPase subunit
MLTIKNLSKTYPGGIQALVDVNLEIPRGMFGLLGPNGAGKSTLMRTIATLQEADAGTIEFDGLDVLREKEAVRKILGYLPQEFGVYPRVSVEAMLDHFAVLKGLIDKRERRESVEGLLEMTNLWDDRKQSLGSLSGGMRQRFGIAQALLGDPELIIVDEPTAGLDPEERRRFLNLLSEIGESVVVVLSTHIVEDVREVCSQMAIVNRGRVLLTGHPSTVISELDGKVWQKEIDKEESASYQANMPVLSTRLVAGLTLIHVLGDSSPGEGFRRADTDLEHVYFAALRQARAPADRG